MSEVKSGRIVTFYSFKGGTGRSMALANIGNLLCADQSDPRILMIDWDLEAPGLHRYFEGSLSLPSNRFSAFASTKNIQQYPGLIDLLIAAYSAYDAPTSNPGKVSAADSVSFSFGSVTAGSPLSVAAQSSASQDPTQARRKEIRETIFGSLDEYLLKCGSERLLLMKAGAFDAETQTAPGKEGAAVSMAYAERVRRFNWEGFYNCDPDFFPAFRRHLAARFDYVLIDSRTGLTDSSGICTKQMPEVLVLVFAPNAQNIEGLVDVVRGVKAYRYSSIDLRPVMIYPLASRIDGAYQSLRDTWRTGGKDEGAPVEGYQRRFERLLKDVYELDECDLTAYFDATQIPHDGNYAYGEKIAVKRGSTTDRLGMGFGYASMTRLLLTDQAPWESTAEGMTPAIVKPVEPEGFLAVLRRRLPVIGQITVMLVVLIVAAVSQYQRYANNAALREGDGYRQQKSYAQAIAAYSRALAGTGIQAYRGRALTKLDAGDVQGAINDLTVAIDKEPKEASLLRTRAFAFKLLGNNKSALEDYSHALSLQTDVPTLKDRAYVYRLTGQDAQADADYQAILRIAPTDQDALLAHALLSRNAKKYEEAIRSYTTAISQQPSDANIYVDRGMTFLEMGNTAQASSDFQKALVLDPNNSPAQMGLRLIKGADKSPAAAVPYGRPPTPVQKK